MGELVDFESRFIGVGSRRMGSNGSILNFGQLKVQSQIKTWTEKREPKKRDRAF